MFVQFERRRDKENGASLRTSLSFVPALMWRDPTELREDFERALLSCGWADAKFSDGTFYGVINEVGGQR